MKPVSSHVLKGLNVGSKLVCADNSGAKIIQIISVNKFKGKRRTAPRCGVSDVVRCKILKGNEKVMHEVHIAIVIRQKKEYRRADGTRLGFESNAAILVNEKMEPKGSIIKGPVAREVIERFQPIGKLASLIV